VKAKFINEVLKPDSHLFDEVKEIFFRVKQSNPDDPFYELNKRLNPLGIKLVDFKNHFDALDPREREQFKSSNMIPPLGVRIMGYSPESDSIDIIVDDTFDDKFLRMPTHVLNNLLNMMWSGFGHETIHKKQSDKMSVIQNPDFFSIDDYFKNKQEIMAMAFSFIEEVKNFHSKEEILNMLRGKAPTGFPGMGMPGNHPLLNVYKKLGGKAYKMFTKYAYQYLNDEEND